MKINPKSITLLVQIQSLLRLLENDLPLVAQGGHWARTPPPTPKALLCLEKNKKGIDFHGLNMKDLQRFLVKKKFI